MEQQPFWIRIPFQGRWYRIKVERLPDEHGKERWQVQAGNKRLLMTNNRPLFMRKNLKQRADSPTWQNEGDQVGYNSFLDLVVKAIELRIDAKG